MKPRILIVDDEPAARHGLKRALGPLDCTIDEEADGVAALAAIEKTRPDLIICDLQMPKMDGIALMEVLGEKQNAPPVIMITADDTMGTAIACMKAGAQDYLVKPFKIGELAVNVERALENSSLRTDLQRMRREQATESQYENIIGRSPPMMKIIALLKRIVASDATTVLLQGESGTGKDLVARAIHHASARREKLSWRSIVRRCPRPCLKAN